MEQKHLSVEDWKKMYEAGAGYRKTAHSAQLRSAVFTPSLIRNICAMGIEAYFMAVFMQRGTLPHNHTMRDLLDDAEKIISIDPALKETMLKIDDQMQLCSLDNIKMVDASAEDALLFIKAIDDVAAIAERECAGNAISAHT